MKKLGIVMLFVLMVFLFASCAPSKTEYEDVTAEFGEEEAFQEFSLSSSGVYEADLKTRPSGVIGHMKVWADSDYLYAEFTAKAPWKLTEVYFDWAANIGALPRTNHWINPKIFDYKWFGNDEIVLFKIPRAGMPSMIYFAEAATFVKLRTTQISWFRYYVRDRQGVCIYRYYF